MKKNLIEWWAGKDEVPEIETPASPGVKIEVEVEIDKEEEKEDFPSILKASTVSNLITIMLNNAATTEGVDTKDLKEKVVKYIEILTKIVEAL